MSQARVKAVAKAQKDPGKCEKCGVELTKGDAYRWFKVGFRSRYKRIRCMKPECTPTMAERESSMMAGVYEAQDEVAGQLRAAAVGDLDAIRTAMEDYSSAVEEVAQQYHDAAEAFGGQGENEERAEILDDTVSEIQSIEIDVEPTTGEGTEWTQEDWDDHVSGWVEQAEGVEAC